MILTPCRPCALYSYSFEPYYYADKVYPKGRQIVQYLHKVASKYQIIDKIQLNTDVSELRWLEDDKLWEATITHMAPGLGDMGEKDRQAYIAKHGRESVYLKQEKVRAKIAVSAIGGLVEPKAWPDHIPGRETFNGELFHTARWKEDTNLENKDVVIIGSGCSSAQVVQALLEEDYNVKSITQLMRSPPWLTMKVPEPDRSVLYPTSLMDALTKYPILGPLFRVFAHINAESEWFNFFLDKEKNMKHRKVYQDTLLRRMRKQAPAEYHDMLTPNYPVGCKRRIFDPALGWYNCMNDSRYKLTTQKLIDVQPNGINVTGYQTYPPNSQQDQTAENEFIPADVILLANGYDIRDWLHPLKVIGKGGKSIHDVWKERGGPQAYMCCAMDGYPNLFILNGPNIYTGHHSVFLSSENMVIYALNMIKGVLAGEVDTVEVKKFAELEWTERIQRELKQTVFASTACNSWYKVENGWNSTTYSRSQTDFAFRCMFPNWSHWDITLTKRGEFRRTLWKSTKYLAYFTLIAGAFWARRTGTNLIEVVKHWSKDRLHQGLQLLIFGISQVQHRLE